MKTFLTALFALFLLGGCGSTFVSLNDLDLEVKNYPNPEELSTLSFALTEPRLKVKTSLSHTITSGLSQRLKYDTEKIACHLTKELKKILIAKGFTITETYRSYDEMTFTQKRNTSALFFPEITIIIDERSVTQFEEGSGEQGASGSITATAVVDIVMMEPLSKEKVWIRSIPVDDIISPIKYSSNFDNNYIANEFSVPDSLRAVSDKMDQFFVDISREVVESTNKYVEQNEFEFLNDDIKRLKAIKRY